MLLINYYYRQCGRAGEGGRGSRGEGSHTEGPRAQQGWLSVLYGVVALKALFAYLSSFSDEIVTIYQKVCIFILRMVINVSKHEKKYAKAEGRHQR